MSVELRDGMIRLSGPCRVEDAEPLVALLQADRGRTVDLTDALHLHAAVVQVLLVFRPPVSATARDPFVAAWVLPLLAAGEAGPGRPAPG